MITPIWGAGCQAARQTAEQGVAQPASSSSGWSYQVDGKARAVRRTRWGLQRLDTMICADCRNISYVSNRGYCNKV